jgi:hypothetical protein
MKSFSFPEIKNPIMQAAEELAKKIRASDIRLVVSLINRRIC